MGKKRCVMKFESWISFYTAECLLTKKKKDADNLQTRVDLIAPRNNSPIYVNAWLTKCTSSATSHQTKTQTKNIHCVAGMSEIVLEDRNGLH